MSGRLPLATAGLLLVILTVVVATRGYHERITAAARVEPRALLETNTPPERIT